MSRGEGGTVFFLSRGRLFRPVQCLEWDGYSLSREEHGVIREDTDVDGVVSSPSLKKDTETTDTAVSCSCGVCNRSPGGWRRQRPSHADAK